MSFFKDTVTGEFKMTFWGLLAFLLFGVGLLAWWLIKKFFMTTTGV